MRRNVILLAVMVVAGIAALLLLKRPSPPATDAGPLSNAPSTSKELLARAEANPDRNTHGREFLKRVYSRVRSGTPVSDTPGMQQIASILEDGDSDAAKARRLLALAVTLPEEEQLEAADHAVNLVTDADYDVLRAALVNPQTPEPVLDSLLADVLSRGNSFKLPALVAIARLPDHPRATEARDLLELHIGEDHGTNWAAWLEAAKNHIAQHGE
jgi:hypothetical protein